MRISICLLTVLLTQLCVGLASALEVGVDRAPEQQHAAGLQEWEQWQPADYDELPEHHLRSLIEMGTGLTLGALGYWLLQDRQVADWDNPTPQERFNGRAWRFDNNSLAVNFVLHPFGGGLAHGLARANHHDVLTAFAYSSLTSFLWEFVLEFKEKVSVNDLIVTSPAGVPLGEFIHKLGLYLDTRAEASAFGNVLGWLLGPGVRADRALDGRAAPQLSDRDELGFARNIWHDYRAGYSFGVVRSAGVEPHAVQRLGLKARLVTLPGYLGPTSFGRGFYQAEVSDFSMTSEVSQHGPGVDIQSETLLAGYHLQSMQGSYSNVSGVAATFGTSLRYRFLRSKSYSFAQFREAEALPAPDLSYHVPTRAEQFAALDLPGPALDWHARLPALELNLRARANPSFVGFGAPAFYDFAASQLEARSKHILHRQGYFYGWGGSYAVAGELQIGPGRLVAHANYGTYRSQQGLDRHVERVTADVRAKGELLEYGAALGLQAPGLPVSVAIGYDVRRWRSEVGSFERRGRAAAQRLELGVRW